MGKSAQRAEDLGMDCDRERFLLFSITKTHCTVQLSQRNLGGREFVHILGAIP